MSWLKSIGGGQDYPISDGGELQCDCTKSGCPCSRWGVWIPKGRPIPNVVVCDKCARGDHSG